MRVDLDADTAAGAIGNHGVYAASDDHNQVFLGRVPGGLSASELVMLHHPDPVTVPEKESEEFFSRVYPRLARKLRVTSPDASVDLPAVLPPKLVSKIRYGSRDNVELDWVFDYNGLVVEAEDRDTVVESALESAALEILNDFPALEAAVLGPKHLQGLDVIDFVRRTLPELENLDGLVIEEKGVRPVFHELTEAPELTITTVESDRRDWFDLGLLISIGDRQIPFADVLRALSNGQTKLLMPDRSYFSLDNPLFEKLRDLVAEAGALRDMKDKDADLSITQYQLSLWEELDALAVHIEGPDAWASSLGALLNLKDSAPAQLPDTLNATLRPYQVEGFGWLSTLWSNGLGGVLADDMGLGKTLQTLALILHAHQIWANPQDHPDLPQDATRRAPFLVVAPTSVVSNWKDEAARFAPSLKVAAITDTETRANATLAQLARDYDIVVTSYTLAAPGRGRVRGRRVGGVDPRRGPVREEQGDQGPPRGPGHARPLQACNHRHPDGKQPDGAVVDLRHRFPGPVPLRRALRGKLPAPDRTPGTRRTAVAAAPADPPVHAAPHQGRGRHGPAAEAGAGAARGALPGAPQDLRHAPAARAPEGAAPGRRHGQEPLYDLPVADPACACFRWMPPWWTTSTRTSPARSSTCSSNSSRTSSRRATAR